MCTKQLSIFQLILVMLACACPVWAHADLQPDQTMEMSTAQLKAQLDVDAADPDESIQSLGPVPYANSANYAFSTTVTGSLMDMSSGTTTLVAADQDDTASTVTLIGFDFYFQDTRQDRFSVNSNGSLRFGATTISTTLYDPLAQAGQFLVTAYGADQRTHAGDGKVHFKVIGTAPNRELVVEWLNTQANFNAGGTADLSYQVHLFETSGVIEFVYGSMNMSAAGAAVANSQSPQFGFSSNSTVGTVGSITAAQSGTPAPSFSGASATPTNNLYVAGTIPALTSAADGSRRTFVFTPPVVVPPGGPLTFTAVTATGMTLNWTDSSNEDGYAIYISTDGTNFSFVNTAAQNATSYVASGLLGGINYFWRVYAFSEGNTAFISGSQTTATPTPNISLGSGLWSAPGTWSTGSVPSGNDAVTIAPGTTVTIDITAAIAYSLQVVGTLQFEQTTARTLSVGTDVIVQGGGVLQSNPAGTQTGHNLSVAGNLINNGTLDFSTNADTAGAIITFTGTTNTSLSGSGATTDIRQITVNKGTTAAPIVEIMLSNFTVRGVTTDTVVGGWLVMSNGTIKLSGTFTGTSRVFAAAGYTIPVTSGFWLNNPNYVVAGQAGSPTLNGQLHLSQGTFNIGTATGNSMGFSAGSTIIVDGAAVNATGRFGVAAAGNAISYTQSAGTITVCTIGNASATLGSFDLGTGLGSNIAINGGTIVTQLAATAIDYRNQAGGGIVGVTGGTLQLGNAASGAAKIFNLRGVLPNVVVTNTSAGHTATMSTTLVNFNNIALNITINTGATFNTANVLFLMAGGSLINNGTLTANGASSNFIWFDAGAAVPQSYSGTGVTTAPVTNMSVQTASALTFTSTNQFITSRVNMFVGNLVNANKLTIGTGGATTGVIQIGNTTTPTAAGTFDAAPTFNLGTGGENISYLRTGGSRSTGPEVNPARSLTNFTYDDNDPSHTLTIAGGDLTATGATTLTNGRVITGANTLIVGSAGTVTRTNGYVDGNYKKTVAAAASVTFENGTANGYAPVVFNVTAGTFPTDIKVAEVQTTAPGIQPTSKVISRYWTLTATGITSDVTFNYLDPTDIPGTVTEANLHVLKHEAGNPADFSDQGGTISTAANTAKVTGVSSFSDWTLGEAFSNLAITITDGVTGTTPGGSVTYTTTASNSGTVSNPAATVQATFPASLTCSTTCSGALGGTCSAGPFAGNINDPDNIPSGGSVTYTSVCSVSPAATGSLSTTATVSAGALGDPDASDNSATDTDGIAASADLSITKTDGVTTATPGGSVTYTITALNAGPSNATGATVADTFPASETCTWTCVGAGGGTCTASGSGNINNTVNLPSGGGVTYTASCTISAAATGLLSNTATVTAPAGVTDPTPGNNSATDSDTLGASADLAITKTDGVTTATPGGNVTYVITASNAGPSNATGATVADTFPASETCTWTCTGAGGGTCTASGSGNINGTVNLPSGGSVSYNATCSISASATGTLSNTATVTAPAGVTDPTPGNNSATDSDTLGASADLSITKTDGVTTATPGGSVTYTITALNAGPSNATGATVADTFPASETCTWTCVGAGGGTCTASGSGNINNTVSLPSGGGVTYTASCSISAAATGTLSNTATVTAPSGVTDPTPGNNSATDSDTLGASADLSITKTDGVTTATPGGSVTYTIVASNAGPSSATGATVADTFPASETCAWTCSGVGGGTCTAAGSGNINDTVNLPSGGSVNYTATCSISPAATGTLSNTATVTAPAGVTDPTPGNNSATDSDTLGASADLSITKTDGVTTATAGGSVTYTIVASNAGPSSATGATVADTFPASETCTWTCSGVSGGTCTAAGSGNINDTTVNLPSAGSVNYSATCSISAAATGTLSNTATVTAPAGVTDPTPGNNSATDSDTLGASADLSITKTDGVTTATPGGSVTYTIVASNAGPSSATGTTVADTFPASETCTWTCSGVSGGTCTAAGSGNINDTVNLPSGGSVNYTATCSISPAATGTLSNTATVTAPAGVTDPTPGNNSATDSDTLGASADLSISKTDGVTTATPGGSVTYTIVASNAGPSSATGATVADTFPASETCTWTCSGVSGGTCTAAGSGNINDTVNLPSGGSVNYTATCSISAAATGTLSNTATVTAPAGVTDPTPGNNSATDSDTLLASTASLLGATKTVSASGGFTPGATIIYTVVVNNTGLGAQTDNPGDEFTDSLPAGITLVSATATSGTTTTGAGIVHWNGSIPAAGSVTITITATINANASGTIVNQGSVQFDADGNGTNESTALTNDPSVGGGTANPTSFAVVRVAAIAVPVPTLDWLALLGLAMALALGAGARQRWSR
ncbi:fibronectin type III domain-containing protein [Pseudolysobacter antarcticus]|nr:G8 domain-containing protein [Pseudolysobacter antarcticus]